jgi:serine/threonine protein kinase
MSSILSSIEAKYEILEKISEGGMGAVYKVRHRLLERIRVIKVMRPQLITDAEMRQRFVREAKLAGSLRHPNIAQVFDFSMEESGQAYLVMEYVPGMTLQDVLKRSGPPSVAFGAVVTAQTLEALAYLHAKGVIHRDLSPDNIMVMRGDDGQPLVKLIDLGIAKLVESEHNLTAAGSFIGKVRYASPELFRTKEGIRIDHRSDLYSMGLVVYELLTGVHPMGETDVSGYIAGHLFNAPEPFASSDPKERIPSDFRHAILRALAKAPDNRFSSARDFADGLRALSTGWSVDESELDHLLETCRPAPQEPGDDSPFSTAGISGSHSGPEVTDLRALLDREGLDTRPQVAPTLSMEDAGVRSTRPAADSERTQLLDGAPSRRPRRRVWPLALASALLMVIAVAVGWFVTRPAAVDTTGFLVVRSTPWAEVMSVTASDGTSVDLAETPITPLRLELEPGAYRVVLQRNGTERDMEASVSPGETTEHMVEFETLSAEDFLASVGLPLPSAHQK